MIMELTQFKAFIRDSCGLLFDGNSEEKLTTVLTERMRETGINDSARYLETITASPVEFQQLINMLTINETYFFREPEQLRLLAQRLIPRMLTRHDGQTPIRILSAGCSSGEEPYSLVMSLLERYGESLPRLCSFTGVDIDSAVLAKARNGRYSEFSFRGVPDNLRSRYFDKSGHGWQLKSEVKKLVHFQELNLITPEESPSLQEFDIVFFRNVSIYFDLPTRKLIQQNLASLMKKDGIMVIGTAETMANDLGILSLVEEEDLFYFAKGNPPLPEQGATLHVPFAKRETTTCPERIAPHKDQPLPVLTAPDSWCSRPTPLPTQNELELLVREKRYDEALPLLEIMLGADRQHQGALLLKAHIFLNRKQFEAAVMIAREVLEREAWSVDAFLLLGLAAKWGGQAHEALGWFKQATYAYQNCWPAHYFMADQYRTGGSIELARREYRVVLQLLATNAADTGVKVIPVGLPANEIRLLCEHQLVKLGSC